MQREKATDGSPDLYELSEVGGFSEVQVGSEIGRGATIGRCVGGAEHEDWNAITAGNTAHMGQHFTAGLARQIQIEDEKRRAFGKSAVVNVVEKFDSFLAISKDAELICDVVLQECFTHEDDVAIVIFHEKNRTGAQSLAGSVFVG